MKQVKNGKQVKCCENAPNKMTENYRTMHAKLTYIETGRWLNIKTGRK